MTNKNQTMFFKMVISPKKTLFMTFIHYRNRKACPPKR